MSKPIIKIINVETGEEVEREMTNAEFSEWQKDQVAADERKAEAASKEIARQALLDKLGITAEEAKLLLS